MKKTALTLCIGMIIGMMIGTTSGVFAAIGDVVEATVSEYIITVDGEEQVLDTSPVAINDSTYVPLRAMANMLGKDVTYKADSRTIELSTPLAVDETEVIPVVDAVADIDIGILDARILDKKQKIESVEKALTAFEGVLARANPEDISYQTTVDNVEKLKQKIATLRTELAALEAQ